MNLNGKQIITIIGAKLVKRAWADKGSAPNTGIKSSQQYHYRMITSRFGWDSFPENDATRRWHWFCLWKWTLVEIWHFWRKSYSFASDLQCCLRMRESSPIGLTPNYHYLEKKHDRREGEWYNFRGLYSVRNWLDYGSDDCSKQSELFHRWKGSECFHFWKFAIMFWLKILFWAHKYIPISFFEDLEGLS